MMLDDNEKIYLEFKAKLSIQNFIANEYSLPKTKVKQSYFQTKEKIGKYIFSADMHYKYRKILGRKKIIQEKIKHENLWERVRNTRKSKIFYEYK